MSHRQLGFLHFTVYQPAATATLIEHPAWRSSLTRGQNPFTEQQSLRQQYRNGKPPPPSVPQRYRSLYPHSRLNLHHSNHRLGAYLLDPHSVLKLRHSNHRLGAWLQLLSTRELRSHPHPCC
ncbi:hypothetical protein MTO96_036209 [Rhipicephalus appendiculatus]